MYTEYVSVKKNWRCQSIAEVMMAETMRKLKNREMKEAALGVDTGKPRGALRVYRNVNFKIDKKVVFYRKEIQS